MPVEHTFDTGIVSINYAEIVEGIHAPSTCPLVLLHGGSARWQAFTSIIPELSRDRHLYAPDFRGHGKSGRVAGSYTMRDYAVDTALFLEHVVGQPAALYGHSLGGQVAIMVAARYPRLVNCLIIGDSPFDKDKLRTALQRARQRLLIWRDMAGPGHSLEEIIEALKNTPTDEGEQPHPVPQRKVFGEDSPWFPYMAENLRLLDPDMLTAVIEFEDMHEGYDNERLFPRISCPVLIVQGNPALGAGLSDQEVEKALSLLPNVSVARLETVGHALDYPDKQPLLGAITSFLDALELSQSEQRLERVL